MDRSKVLLNAFRAAGLAAFLLLAVTKVPTSWAPFLSRLCPYDVDYGDMYREALIGRFKLRLPDEVGPALSHTEPSRAAEFDVFEQGDSFSPFRRGHENFVQSLSERLGKPVFSDGWDDPDPTCIFTRLGRPLDPKRKRVVVMETVERLIGERLEEPHPCPAWMDPRWHRSAARAARRLFEMTFSDNEKSLRGVLCYNRLMLPLMERLFSLRFAATGVIDASPVYSLDPPFLFTYLETTPGLPTSFYYPHDDAMIARIADNIARIREELAKDANAELVFLPVPDKFTIYHSLVDRDRYDDYLPRLADALDARGVRNVRLYERYRAEKELTYFPTDLHWNPLGMSIAIDETMKVIQGPAPRVARK